MPFFMADERALNAIRRLERALARVEAAATRPQPPAPAPSHSEDLRLLMDVHETLRSRVEGAIGQIDRLLESAERR